jgi:pimeloyl-ACP methyl ester carboxylesterase
MSNFGLSQKKQTDVVAPDVLWLSVSPGFRRLDAKLLGLLARHLEIRHWAYCQTPDEPACLETALMLLHDYMQKQPHPVHLLGHGTSGMLGLLYARRYPHRVKSLTLLAVGVNPMLDWQSHYYQHLQTSFAQHRQGWGEGDRTQVLQQMAHSLFGHQAKPLVKGWIRLLEQDLIHSPSPQSLLKRVSLCPGSVPMPLMVCGSRDDAIVDASQLEGWRPWLKPGDRLWQCAEGRHFFHAVHPQRVANQVLGFLDSRHQPLAFPLDVDVA